MDKKTLNLKLSPCSSAQVSDGIASENDHCLKLFMYLIQLCQASGSSASIYERKFMQI